MSKVADREAAATTPAASNRLLPLIGLILIYAFCLPGGWHPFDNNSDFWAHAAIGRWIVDHGYRAPHQALFLWTAHNAWIAHSWLSEVLIYQLLHHAGESAGPVAALMLTGLLAFAAYALLWGLCRINDRNFGLSTIVFTLAAFASVSRMLARPEIFSLLFLAVLFMALLRRDAERHHPNPPRGKGRELTSAMSLGMVLAPMFVLWTNLHGGVIVGVMALWIYALAEMAQERNWKQASGVVGVAAVCTCATLVNPYGYHYYSIYCGLTSLTFSQIVEWRPLFASPTIDGLILGPILLLAASAAVLWYLTPGRRWAHLAWILVFAALTVDARRNLAYLNLAALAAAVPYLRAVGSTELTGKTKTSKQQGRLRTGALATGGVVMLVAWFTLGWFGRPDAISPLLPSGICGAVRAMGIQGRVFNEYDSGSYLEWKLGGNPDIYIDSMNAYPDSLYNDYLDILDATPRGMQLLDDGHIDCIIGEHMVTATPGFPNIYYAISERPEWALVYFGADGPVWVRRLPQLRNYWQGIPNYNGDSGDTSSFLHYLLTTPHLLGHMK